MDLEEAIDYLDTLVWSRRDEAATEAFGVLVEAVRKSTKGA